MPIFRQLKNVMGFVNPETREDEEFDKPYLLLIKNLEDGYPEQDDYFQEFSGTVSIRGRKAAYDYLKERLGSFDLIHSYVLSGAIPLGKEPSIYTFLRLCITKYFSQSTELTIDDLNAIVYQTSNIDSEKFDIDVLFNREINQPK